MGHLFSPRRGVVLLLVVLTGACGAGVLPGPRGDGPPPPNPAGTHGLPASQLSLVVRVDLEENPGERTRRARLTAVVYDGDGRQTTTDLGTFPGDVRAVAPQGNELIRLHLDGDGAPPDLTLHHGDDHIHVRGGRPGEGLSPADGRLLLRIPVPAGSTVRARQPSLEWSE